MQLTQFSEFFITDFRLFKSFELSPSKQAKSRIAQGIEKTPNGTHSPIHTSISIRLNQ
ncbi:hypothetical protein VIBNIFTn2_550020 [Vibrio nigripulchritudo FTn2]|nr:hypothetical protein VIBNIFTn2_550020 [Vibrio nigripulchritudo FTn2]CCN69407.1 hypothetical protein VIBNISFn118_1320006 [Vibrio nigripulchritudo SFn118]